MTTLVVSTILTIINHEDSMLLVNFSHPAKIVLTYLMPYIGTMWGSIFGKKAKLTE